MSKPQNRALRFLGFGRTKPAADDSQEDPEAKSKAQQDDDCDEEDEDEAKAEGDEAKQAVRGRNALRAAGHRRGVAAERERIGAIVSGVEPAKAELALHFALNTDMTPEQAKGAIDKAPAGGAAAGNGSSFERMMAKVNEANPAPSFGGSAPAKGPSLTGRMDATLKKMGWTK